jgi:multidrug resistance efflux pump
MAEADLRKAGMARPSAVEDRIPLPRSTAAAPAAGWRLLPTLITLAVLVLAGVFCWRMWQIYVAAPWTRDGTVRVYVATMAPEVAGRAVALPIADNQFVHKGDLLVTIDPTDYRIAVDLAEATVAQTCAKADNAQREARRRSELSTFEASVEQK